MCSSWMSGTCILLFGPFDLLVEYLEKGIMCRMALLYQVIKPAYHLHMCAHLLTHPLTHSLLTRSPTYDLLARMFAHPHTH